MDIRHKTSLLCTLLFCLPLYLWASVEVRSRHMTTHDGIANNSIRCIFQDSKGFLWMGTLNGLSRYDGSSFLNFYPETDKLSLADHRIRRIDEDKHGFLWINLTNEMYSCYDLNHGCFVDFTGCGEYGERYGSKLQTSLGDIWLWHKSNGCRWICYRKRPDGDGFRSIAFKQEKGNLPSNHVNYVYEDYCQRIWIGMDKGVALTEQDGKTRLLVRDPNAYAAQSFGKAVYFLSSRGVISAIEDGSETPVEVARIPRVVEESVLGTLSLQDDWYIFTTRGGYVLHTRTGQLTSAGQLNIPNAQVTQDNRGNYWLYNGTGVVWHVNVKTHEVIHFRLMEPYQMGYIDRERYSFVHDSRDILWMSTYGNGLFAYDLHTGELQHFTANMDGSSHIRSNFLQYLMEDSSQGIWISSEFTGVSRLSVLNESVQRIYPNGINSLGAPNIIRVVTRLKDDGHIWVSARNGSLYVCDNDLNVLSKEHFEHSNIYAVAEDRQGKVWLGSRGNGLRIDGKWYVSDREKPGSLGFNHIFCFLCDSKGRMWIGTFGGGLDLAVPQADGTYTFRHFLNKTYGQRQVRSLLEDHNGRIWVGTSDGAFVFRPEELLADSDRYVEFSSRNGKLRNNEIKCLYEDRNGRMWLGTSGAGICVCQPDKDLASSTFRHYTTNEGLVNDMVQSIIEDRDGRFWISTEYGISCFNPSDHSFQNYFFSAFELGNVYIENSGCMLPDGRIAFGSNYGLVVFDPRTVKSNHASRAFDRVVLTSLRINGVETRPNTPGSPLENDIAYTDRLRLNHKQNSLIITFSTFNYSPENEANYTYKLENYDKEWVAPSSLNFAIYRNLPPGKYVLRVKSCKGSGTTGCKETTLDIVIAPPFYQTTWAYLFYVLLCILIAWLLFRLMHKFNTLRNRIEVEKPLTEYKLVFFTNISHEFRTPLTLIQGALERIAGFQRIPREMLPSLKIMEKSTLRLLRLINQLLEFRKMQNNKLALSLEETDVMAFFYEIFLTFRDMAASKDIDFRFLPSVESYTMFIDKGNLDKVVYNLLSNAFKYTPSNGQVLFRVKVNEEAGTLDISVSDTGVGIPKEKRGELFNRFMQSSFSANSVGVGLHLTHELVNIHKGTITYRENEGGGSVFTVTLPLHADAYEEKDFLKPSRLQAEDPAISFLDREEGTETDGRDDLPQPGASLNPRKVLIIEDDDDVRRFLQEEISRYFEVHAKPDGKSGLEEARAYNPDLIICDVLMPGMNGFEVTRRLKEDFNTCHIPVVLLTALDSADKRLEGMKKGADLYIGKPFSLKYLLTCIMKLIEQRDKLRDKFSRDSSAKTNVLVASELDQKFIDELNALIGQRLADPDLSINDLMTAMHLGRTTFNNKVCGITGYTPSKYIRLLRLKKSAELLLEQKYNVSEVCYMVGFSDPYYFSKCFKQQFGVPPSCYAGQERAGEPEEAETKE